MLVIEWSRTRRCAAEKATVAFHDVTVETICAEMEDRALQILDRAVFKLNNRFHLVQTAQCSAMVRQSMPRVPDLSGRFASFASNWPHP